MSTEEALLSQARQGRVPVHIAIVMDGNGRWAKQRGLPRSEGHRAGVETVKRVIPALLNLGVKYCTLFAFSTENWLRPAEEVRFLMELLVDYARSTREDLIKNHVKVVPVGKVEQLPSQTYSALSALARDTSGGDALTLALAVNYGGRAEILEAAKRLAREAIQNGDTRVIDELSEDRFREYLFTAGLPDPDLIIRTSGEKRLSNFLLWQAAYAEFVFLDVLWPDFDARDLYKAVIEYSSRDRRFGRVGEK